MLLLAAACGAPYASPQPGNAAKQTTTVGQPPSTASASMPAAPNTSAAPGAAQPGTPPPPLHVRGAGRDTVLPIWSSCWQSGSVSGCGDGRPPEAPPDIGSPAEVEVEFDTPGWRFSATAVATGQTCGGRQQSVDLEATGSTTHRLVPIGSAGDYTITLNGRSTEAATNMGDVATTFRWHTTSDGPNEPPSATVSIVGSRPGDKLSFAGELSAQALGVSTRTDSVTASAVITSSTGARLTVDFHPTPGLDCLPEGSLAYRTKDEVGAQVAALGPPPLRYDVTLVLGSVAYRGTGSWPSDVISDCSPCTRLQFNPPLPAL